jgi:HPt (histidine-containing phosphotransfer) domain-containing protein
MLLSAQLPSDPASVCPTPAKPPVDLTQLRRFTLGSVDLEQEILGLYAEQAPIMMQGLMRAKTERDWRDATHTLKGSSASIGAWLVANAAALGERAAEHPSQWDAIRRDVDAAIGTSLAYLKGFMAPGEMGRVR